MLNRFSGLALLAASILALSACDEKDVEYYKEHLDEAKTTLDQCKVDIISALKTRDIDAAKELEADKECMSADIAYRAHKETLRQEEAQRRRVAAAEVQKQFILDVDKEVEKLSSSTLDEIYEKKKACKRSRDQSVTCAALAKVLDKRMSEEKDRIAKTHQGEALITLKKGRCEGIDYSEVACKLTKQVVEEQRKSVITDLLDNRDTLKITFNECQSEYQNLRSQKKRKEASAFIKNWKCSTALDAAKKLKIRGYSKPIS